ncbi:hypothetical protein SUGI_0801060 [Cryptomeria japonica]|nr:hypothetical protein SUGI_0801060 [Cryptomeria japonica]
MVRNQSLKDFLCSWPKTTKNTKWGILWVVRPSLLTWHLWKETNCHILNDEVVEVEVLIPKIKHAIEEVVNIKTLGIIYKSYTKWDMAMDNFWLLSKKNDYKLFDLKSCRKNMWIPPPSGFLKINFDGACRGNPSEFGFGAIIHDELGVMMGDKYGPLGVLTNNIAEVTTLEAGLEWCVEKGVHKVMVEGDSQVILNGISNQQFTD